MRNLFRFCCSSLQVTAEADVLASCCVWVCGRKYFRLFSGYFNEFFAHVSAGTNISCSFGALYFWSDSWIKCFRFLLVHFVINFMSKWLREEKIFSVPYHWFCAKVAAEAIAIFLIVYFIIDFVGKWLREQWWFRRPASGSEMWGVLAFVLFFH